MTNRNSDSLRDLEAIEQFLHSGRVRHALTQLHELERKNVDLRGHIDDLRAKAESIKQGLESKRDECLLQLSDVGAEVEAGYLAVGKAKLDKLNPHRAELPEEVDLWRRVDKQSADIQARAKQAQEAQARARSLLAAGQASKALTSADMARKYDQELHSWRDSFAQQVTEVQRQAMDLERESRQLVSDARSALGRGELQAVEARLAEWRSRAASTRTLHVFIRDWVQIEQDVKSLAKECETRRDEWPAIQRKFYSESRDMLFNSARATLSQWSGRNVAYASWIHEQREALERRERITEGLRGEERDLLEQVRRVGVFGPITLLRARLEDLQRRVKAHSPKWKVDEYALLDQRLGHLLVFRKNLLVAGGLLALFCLWALAMGLVKAL